MLKCSIGIIGYNEEQNISSLLERVLRQDCSLVQIEEIIVVASGCTDKTVPIAKEYEKKDSRVFVIEEEKRTGKWNAINLFIQKAKTELLVMISADVLPQKDTVEKLVAPFQDPEIGMTAVHSVPTNDPSTFMGLLVQFYWNLFHEVCLITPKTGEMVGFRKVINAIPPNAVDEPCIEFFVKKKGLESIYIPNAMVQNKGPETIREFLRQRRRIWWGYFHFVKSTNDEFRFISPSFFTMIGLIIKTTKWSIRMITHVPLFIAL